MFEGWNRNIMIVTLQMKNADNEIVKIRGLVNSHVKYIQAGKSIQCEVSCKVIYT